MVVFEGSFLNLLTIRTQALQMSFDEIFRSLKHPRKLLEYLSQSVNRELKNENVGYLLLYKIDDKDVVLHEKCAIITYVLDFAPQMQQPS